STAPPKAAEPGTRGNPTTSSLRAKRSNPGRSCAALDCFASLAMTKWLQPADPLELRVKQGADQPDHAQHSEITVAPAALRHESEVPAVNPGSRGRRRQGRRPGRELAGDRAGAALLQQTGDLQDIAQRLVKAVGAGRGTVGVIVDVAEPGPGARIYRR